MYELYYSPGACSLAPHILLHELGAPHKLVKVPVGEGANTRPEYLAINSKALVPALRLEDHSILTEAVAIMLYLARKHGGEALLGDTNEASGRMLEWCLWLSNTVHSTGFGALWRPARFAPEASHPVISETGRATILRNFAAIEAKFADGRDWAVVGAGYTLADIFLLVFYRWGGRIGLDMARDYPAWTRRAARVRQREAVQKAWETEGLT